MARNANRYRQRLQPEEPRDLDFELKKDCLPDGFLRGDVRVKDRRHLIFATKEQLKLLSKTKHWYMDGTFKLCRQPFVQLYSINALVLEKIIEILPEEPRVKRVVLDFEKSVRKAIPKVLPRVKLSGCGFHWSQAVWRKIQYLGLQAAYHEHRPTHMFLRKVMALPYVPADDVEDILTGSYNRLTRTLPYKTFLNTGERHGSTAIDGIQPLGLFIEGISAQTTTSRVGTIG
ncbi:unnamed protein product [Pocillopora meandrina]|uniref:MULE transposase domain-containing protein n=1 Tax=Pocillopora meandrina TaxID=46732 RepID=A0AAU9XA03_9CNID|nr:unnamed protein product [Pocillopora meandrina]